MEPHITTLPSLGLLSRLKKYGKDKSMCNLGNCPLREWWPMNLFQKPVGTENTHQQMCLREAIGKLQIRYPWLTTSKPGQCSNHRVSYLSTIEINPVKKKILCTVRMHRSKENLRVGPVLTLSRWEMGPIFTLTLSDSIWALDLEMQDSMTWSGKWAH